MKRDGANKSLWQVNPEYIPVNNTVGTAEYDVIIIGGGITGVSTALQLQRAGKKCLLLEAYTLGFGTTGGTTAHLNTFFDTPYNKVIKNFSRDKAQLLAHAAVESMALIKQNITDYNISCNYKTLDGYLFSINENQDKELDEIVAASQSLGIAINFTNNSLFPIPYLKLAVLPDQAQFDPIKYLFALAKTFENMGGVILQHQLVVSVEEKDEQVEVKTASATYRGGDAIYATHIPPGINILHFRCAPYRSYAMAVKLKGEYPNALGYDMNDPYHYYRTQEVEGERYLIVGGEDHKTGHEENPGNCLRRLESHVRSYFDVESIAYKWSSQYYEPADGLPYIGHLPGANGHVYVATGFGGNGMIYGTTAAIVLSEMIAQGRSKYQELFEPKRVKPVAGFSNFIKENVDVLTTFIKGKVNIEKLKEVAAIAAGEAKVLKLDGHLLALYKDPEHNVHALSAVCTHTKCTVAWNNTEKTWDCPCHGARYSVDGEVLTGPALDSLKKIDLEEKIST